MRTTVDINPDLLERIRKLADAKGISFKDALNRIITRGLAPAAKNTAAHKPYRLPKFDFGVDKHYDLRKLNQQLADEDTEDFLRKFYPERVQKP